MEITPDHKYIVYRVANDYDGESHIVLDLTAAFPSLSAMAEMFVQTSKQMPPAFSWRHEVTAHLEDEAFVLLSDFVLDSALDEWDEDEEGRYDIIDHLTGKPFDSMAELALLTGRDLLRLNIRISHDSWPFPCRADLVFRSGNSQDEVFVLPAVFADTTDDGRRYLEFTSSGGHTPWGRLERAITSFMACGG